METRNPNKRASTEYAPGPRSVSAAASSTVKIQMKSPERKPISKLAMAAAPAITDKNGVKKPMIRAIDINKIAAKIRGAEDTPKRLAKLMRKTAATEILKSNKANPGPP